MKKEIIHIGFSKCASTFLQSIFLSNNDINYICKSERYSVLNNYNNLFKYSKSRVNFESDEHIVLPSSHPQLHRVRVTLIKDLEVIFNRMYDANPDCKLILVIRNHKDLLKSRYSQFVIGSGGKLSFDKFSDHMLGISNDKCYFQNYYYKIIKIIERKFSPENILVLLHEDIVNNPDTVINSLNNFCSTQFILKQPTILNQRKSLSNQGLKIAININNLFVYREQSDINKVRVNIPRFFYKSIIRFLRLIDYFNKSEETADSIKQEQKLRLLFEHDNKLLSEYLQRDLTKLNYY